MADFPRRTSRGHEGYLRVIRYLERRHDGFHERRGVLKRYALPLTGPLFDNAYAYIRENY